MKKAKNRLLWIASLVLAFSFIDAVAPAQAQTLSATCSPAFQAATPFQATRVRTACDFKTALLKRYAPLYQKEQRVRDANGAPLRALPALDRCIQAEVSDSSSESPQAYLEWTDRMRACSAQFQDTHLEISPIESSAWISLGFSLRELAGRYYIDSRYPRFLVSHGGFPLLSAVEVGTEVLALDHKPIAQALSEILPFIGGSSELYRRQEGLRRLTERNFRYPTQPRTILTLANGREIALDWAVDLDSGSSAPSSDYLQAAGFLPSQAFPWLDPSTLPPRILQFQKYEGYYDEAPPLPVTALNRLKAFYEKDSFAPALAFVLVTRERDSVEQNFCYLQLSSFGDDRVVSEKRGQRAYSAPLRKFLRDCQRAQAPLVLDIRSNGGGYIDLGSQSFSALLPKRSRADSRATWAYRESEIYQEIESGYFNGQYWAENSIEVSPAERADRRVRGFSGNVLALTTPSCISSCDRLAALLKASGRALLLGSPTNGTGAGFMDAFDPSTGRLQSEWQDSSGILQAQIPDMLFGAIPSREVPVTSSRPQGLIPWLKWILSGRPTDGSQDDTEYLPMTLYGQDSLIENRPTLPHIPFEIRALDLQLDSQQGSGAWLQRIHDVLRSAERLDAPL